MNDIIRKHMFLYIIFVDIPNNTIYDISHCIIEYVLNNNINLI